MAMANRSGKMAQSMMVSGRETKRMVMAHLYMQMAISMKDNGSMIRHMDMELINMLMEPLM